MSANRYKHVYLSVIQFITELNRYNVMVVEMCRCNSWLILNIKTSRGRIALVWMALQSYYYFTDKYCLLIAMNAQLDRYYRSETSVLMHSTASLTLGQLHCKPVVDT